MSMRSYNPTTSGHKGQIKRAPQTLVAASKPVYVYVGGGAINAHCEPQLRASWWKNCSCRGGLILDGTWRFPGDTLAGAGDAGGCTAPTKPT
ncbi:hypothetical protein LNP74_00845 [Klebsiella pneumoniae subsp. pneumoniae]|nr:hypothetical protein [Klebsiella pneumoniae subsp. pneumoniae]